MITVVLVKPITPANIGFICRVMANFDVHELILIEPQCNHLDNEALFTSKHAKKILKNALLKSYSYFKELKNNFDYVVGTTSILGTDYNIARKPLTPEQFAQSITKNKIALVLGSEGPGLNNKEITMCDFTITIPTSKKYPPMNISHALSIILYEIYKYTGKNKINSHIAPASGKDTKLILENINQICKLLDFTNERKIKTQSIAWKRIINRSMMSKREFFVVMGFFRKLYQKLSKSGDQKQ